MLSQQVTLSQVSMLLVKNEIKSTVLKPYLACNLGTLDQERRQLSKNNDFLIFDNKPSNFTITDFKYSGSTVGYCDEAMSVLTTQNAGGSSELSECISMQIMYNQFGARGVKTEMEVKYWNDHWKRCDYVTRFGENKHKTAVSVTRAMTRRKDIEFTRQMAGQLFVKKLSGLVSARSGMNDYQTGFDNCILHVLCTSDKDANTLWEAYYAMNQCLDEKKCDIFDGISVVVTIVRGDLDHIKKVF
jgi:hypothetical protein